MTKRLFFFLAVMVLFCCAPDRSQAQTESLLIGPGDQLHINVFETPELEQHVRVTDAGDVPLTLVGSVHVAGLTPGLAANLINSRLVAGNYMLHPQVTVVVEAFGTQTVSVLGEVKTPGTYTITAPRTALDLIAMAGGLNPSADRQITIKHKDAPEGQRRYFLSNDASAAIHDDVLIYPGDIVIVSKAGITYVLGDVRLPGGYVMNNNDGKLTVLELIAAAGGLNHSATPSKARLIRKEADGNFQTVPLDISAVQKGKQPDLPLKASDIIYIPFSYLKNAAVSSTSNIVSSTSSALIYAR